jgi:hypothetical protein
MNQTQPVYKPISNSNKLVTSEGRRTFLPQRRGDSGSRAESAQVADTVSFTPRLCSTLSTVS